MKERTLKDVSSWLDKTADVVTDELERAKGKNEVELMNDILSLITNIQEARKKIASMIKTRMPHQ